MMNLKASEKLFTESSTSRLIAVIALGKQTNDTSATPNVITKAAFQEMIDFEEFIYTVPFEYNDTVYDAEGNTIDKPMQGKKLFYPDIC